MSITVNTNMQALKIQDNLNSSTSKMNTAMQRMSSGSKINTAADDAAGYAVSTKLQTSINSSKVAANNIAIGSNLLDTTAGTLDVILSNLQRIRDLATQAANGTYSSDDLGAISAEAVARANEINILASNTTFNGINVLNNSQTAGVTLQVGTTGNDKLTISSSIFNYADVSTLGMGNTTAIGTAFSSATNANGFLSKCDAAIKAVTTRQTDIGAFQNRLSAAADGNNVQALNLTAANSTTRDADVAAESANYVKSQILQSASATLLVQANSAPQVALQLIKG